MNYTDWELEVKKNVSILMDSYQKINLLREICKKISFDKYKAFFLQLGYLSGVSGRDIGESELLKWEVEVTNAFYDLKSTCEKINIFTDICKDEQFKPFSDNFNQLEKTINGLPLIKIKHDISNN